MYLSLSKGRMELTIHKLWQEKQSLVTTARDMVTILKTFLKYFLDKFI